MGGEKSEQAAGTQCELASDIFRGRTPGKEDMWWNSLYLNPLVCHRQNDKQGSPPIKLYTFPPSLHICLIGFFVLLHLSTAVVSYPQLITIGYEPGQRTISLVLISLSYSQPGHRYRSPSGILAHLPYKSTCRLLPQPRKSPPPAQVPHL